MSVDPALGALFETIEQGQPWPRPRCPDCDAGHIRFGEPVNAESLASERAHPAFEPAWIRGTFAVLGECENPDCRQTVHGSGDYRVSDARDSYREDEFHQHYVLHSAYYRVAHLYPPLHLMRVPKSAPDEVREGVLRASRVLFADPGLAATALRATVERFLTDEGIAARDSKQNFRSADSRIKEWGGGDPGRAPVAKLLMAVKWLGNHGTHEDAGLTTDELLIGASLLDEAFHLHYDGPDIHARAQSINDANAKGRTP